MKCSDFSFFKFRFVYFALYKIENVLYTLIFYNLLTYNI